MQAATSRPRQLGVAIFSLGLAILVVMATARFPPRSIGGDLIFIASDERAQFYPLVGAVILGVGAVAAALRWRLLGWVSLFCVILFGVSAAYLVWLYSLAHGP